MNRTIPLLAMLIVASPIWALDYSDRDAVCHKIVEKFEELGLPAQNHETCVCEWGIVVEDAGQDYAELAVRYWLEDGVDKIPELPVEVTDKIDAKMESTCSR